MLTNRVFFPLIALLTAAGFASTPMAAPDELSAAKKADIRALLELRGVRRLPEQMANLQIQRVGPMIKQLDPKFPEKGFQLIFGELTAVLTENAEKPQGLYDIAAGVYHERFTAEEIKDILKFQQTPVAKKLTEMEVGLNNDLVTGAMRWAQTFSQETDKHIAERLKKEGLKMPPLTGNGAPGKAPAKSEAKGEPKK